jgi:two-component system cell cycle sensor histidine kinase/response regulator CckA
MLRHHEGDPDFDSLYQIRGQTERVASTISHLLAFSRRQTMRRQVTQLSETLDEMRFMLNTYITERVTFRAHHDRDLGLVRIDRGEFGRVIMNLTVNACDAMKGGGTLTVTTRNVAPDEVASFGYDPIPKADFVLIEIGDTGSGISKADLGSIFEPFFTTKPTGKGTGLGLATVYGIIKQMEGYIYCVSELGKGTTFQIFLPRYFGAMEAEVDTTKTDAAVPRDLSGTGRVLLVEDEDSVRSFAVRALELRGYTVTQAASGQEALDVIEENPEAIDLIVSDVVMPEMTGPEMMRTVRAIRPEMKFIFISGYAEDAFREEMMDGEEFFFLAKPFSLKDLAVKVKKAFQH